MKRVSFAKEEFCVAVAATAVSVTFHRSDVDIFMSS